MARFFRVVPAFSAFAFSIVACVFSFAALTSREWAVRDNFDPTLNTFDWETPIYTIYRSPFIVCGAIPITTGNPAIITGYNVTCQNFSPFGFNRTSCELAVATKDDTAINIGDARLCQQIHLAGNFGIASTVFFTVGVLLTAVMAFSTFVLVIYPIRPREDNGDAGEAVSKPPDSLHQLISNPHHTHFRRGHRGYKRSLLFPNLNLLLIVVLTVGIITALISQFYGILGLIQSAPNNADFASSAGNSDTNTNSNHGPWYQGKALSVYGTVAWGFALATAATARRAWRLPGWG